VEAGERLATLESMKMEMSITTAVAGTVKWVGCTEQGKVERNQELFLVEA
jgi:biotin carboxyl carrier protein